MLRLLIINHRFMTGLMESELNRTPVKADFDYDSESPVGAFSDMLEKSDSPSYVKWDFIVPAFSDKIKNAAMKLKSDVRKERLKQIRNLRRRCQSSTKFTPTKNKNGSPFNNKTFSSVKKLHKILDEIFSEKEKTEFAYKSSETCSSYLAIDKCKSSDIEKHSDRENVLSNEDLFNDSVNDLFAECSQTVEDTFYTLPKKKLFHKEQWKNEEITKVHLSGNVDQLINEKDDDLFLKIDLNNLGYNS